MDFNPYALSGKVENGQQPTGVYMLLTDVTVPLPALTLEQQLADSHNSTSMVCILRADGKDPHSIYLRSSRKASRTFVLTEQLMDRRLCCHHGYILDETDSVVLNLTPANRGLYPAVDEVRL